MESSNSYFPPPESKGGWRRLQGDDELLNIAGVSAGRLDAVANEQLRMNAGLLWSVVVVLKGYVVLEVHAPVALASTRFDIWSGSKSFTATAWGVLLDELSRSDAENALSLDDTIYDLIPDSEPLTDPLKADITLRHLLSMTSGIPGDNSGINNTPTDPTVGAFEHALGRNPNRHEKWAAKLTSAPGTAWDYSDPAYLHLSPLFRAVAGRELADFMQDRVFSPTGIEQVSWDSQGGGSLVGPHTTAQTGLHISARELARFGYLMLRGGSWADQQPVPKEWIEEFTQPSQPHNTEYGLGWWVNRDGTTWPYAPRDTFALAGMLSNRCYVVPSLDLVIARVGNGPMSWNDRELLKGVIGSLETNTGK